MVRINQTKNSPEFQGIYNNRTALSALEAIANHSASFSAGAMFIGATVIRPLAIGLTPKVDRENKKILSAESISSGIVKLLIALGVSIPIENAVKKIDKNQIKNKDNFEFLSQIVKLSSNLISSIPKSILGVALIPVVADLISSKNKKQEKQEKKETLLENVSFSSYKNSLSFKGNKLSDAILNLTNSKFAQEFANKNLKNKNNIARNMTVLTDVALTSGSVLALNASKKIKKEDKKPLIINKVLSTIISILAGCSIDKLAQKLGDNFIKNFKKANLNSPKLSKYLEGINVLRPTIIFALVYYALIPIFTAYMSDKISKIDCKGE